MRPLQACAVAARRSPVPPADIIKIYYFQQDEAPARDLLAALRRFTIPFTPKLHLFAPRGGRSDIAKGQLAIIIFGPDEPQWQYNPRIRSISEHSKMTIFAVASRNNTHDLLVPETAVVINFDYSPAGINELAYKIVDEMGRKGLVRPVEFGEASLAALGRPLVELDLPGYVAKRLANADITHIGDLAERTEAEILRVPLIGRETLFLLRRRLAALGLRFGMDLPGWKRDSLPEVSDKPFVARLAQIEQEPLGAQFEPQNDRLAIDHSGAESDSVAAQSELVRQLHKEVTRKAKDLYPTLLRLDNQVGWHGIGGACERLTRGLDRDTASITSQLGALYSASLEMGSFLELDRRIQKDSSASALPLDQEVRRPLEDLIRTLAPWLRSFPTIRELDDQAGQFSAPNPLVAPAGEVIAKAADASLVRPDDFEILNGLVEAGGRGEVQGTKASHRGVLSARNLVITTGKVLAALAIGALGSDLATKSVLIQRTGTFLVSAEQPIMEVISELPSDVRLAVEALLEDTRKSTPVVPKEPRLPERQGQPDRRRRRDAE